MRALHIDKIVVNVDSIRVYSAIQCVYVNVAKHLTTFVNRLKSECIQFQHIICHMKSKEEEEEENCISIQNI